MFRKLFASPLIRFGLPALLILTMIIAIPGTRALAGKRPGDRVAVLGPLGKPFGAAGEDPADARPVALVAGGVGSAPLLLLGRRLLAEGVRFDFFYGGRGAVDLARRETFAELEQTSGTTRAEMERFATLYASAGTAVLVWSMGITQHAHGVDNVRAIVNLGLARGNVGRLCDHHCAECASARAWWACG